MNRHETFYRELVDELPDLVCRYLGDGTLLYVNKAYAEYHGYTPEQMVGMSFLELVPEPVRAEVVENLRMLHFLTHEQPVFVNEHRSGDRHGRIRWQQWIDKAVFDDEGRVVEFISAGRDVTERHEAEQLVAYHARHDQLTGLVNRRSILEELEASVARAHASSRRLGVLYVDLDGFKHINDTLGHASGDEYLAAVGRALADAVRATDLVGRIGGDEFVVVCADVQTLPNLEMAAVRIARHLRLLEPPCEASVGVALLDDGEDADALLHRADLAMYASKAAKAAPTR